MVNVVQLDRRRLFKTTGLIGSALVLGVQPSLGSAAPATMASALTLFVSIASDGRVTIASHRAEMGQGISTSTPQMIADELEVDWDKVEVVLAPGNSGFGDQSTGGSASIREYFEDIRRAGAVVREMLKQAAAQQWGVAVSEVAAKDHAVVHKASGKTLGFGELAAKAAKLPVPDAESVKLKNPADFKYIGKDFGIRFQDQIVTGRAKYAQDIQREGMLVASIERPPVVLGKVKSFDASDAKKVPGVVDVVRLKDRGAPMNTRPVGGVAVLATNTWAAHEGRKKLKVTWDLGPNASHNTDSYTQELIDGVEKQGIAVRTAGDVYAHKYDAANTVEATYVVPYHHHMMMETPSATAWLEGDKCVVWTGSQTPQWGQALICQELGWDPKKDTGRVEFNQVLMGGAFGRKGKNDFAIEAVELTKATGKPVKVVWTREDDVKHGFYHSIAANYFKAEVTPKKSADFWVQRVLHPQIGWIFNPESDQPDTGNLSQNFADLPFQLDNLSCETNKVKTHLRIGWFRAVQNIHNAFARGCFVDELAEKAGISTAQMWYNLIGEDRTVDPGAEGFEGWSNYGQNPKPQYALKTARMKHVLREVLRLSGAEKTVADNEGWGIAYATSFNSYVAAATKVRVVGKKLTVLEMHTAIDTGTVITPDRVKSQMEGAMIMGLSLAISEITVRDGAIVQSNFHDYPVARMPQVPPLHAHIIASDEAPGGVGEPGLPPVLPSLVNAIYHASGRRIRHMPVTRELEV
ncbi:molybdopterin cofactor-binding domain-containing protein [Teredinibacter turnerae]|uniref:xanthine dehydrogenase family protein molybdopterin-binding subunit n=1 Tax=Teredinibacter turnerae TaxID=2426 RepID=UPI0003776B9B|nr:molybdopterin cofactor-binding domain-containing protein [Teredinibacter turnerae]